MAKPEVGKADRVHIVLVYSPAPRQVREWRLALAEGGSVEQALAASNIFEAFPELLTSRLAIGVWGRKTSLAHQLKDKDRVEIYRGLRVDPKVARRERFNRQGVKSAGLFAKTRAGAKAGY
jgi:putative ubiquitin-RnfH superfamily antitoxin RatB of RatAB toxin-antitoxin module